MVTFSRGIAITPNDSTNLSTPVKTIIVSVTGTLKVDLVGIGTGLTIQAIAGTPYALSVKKVYATDTSATGIIGLY